MGSYRENKVISVIIPISNKDQREGWYEKQEPFLLKAIRRCDQLVEIIVKENSPEQGRVWAKNKGASEAKGDILVFIDCDCYPDENFFKEICEKSVNEHCLGGGVKRSKMSRYSPGIIAFLIPVAFYLWLRSIPVGAFWIRKWAFNSMGGFNKTKYDDIDFALRLKKYAHDFGYTYSSLKKTVLIWSCRKFDEYGDWHWLRGYNSYPDKRELNGVSNRSLPT
jgi:glycosyltransferase involved in cell wall biosynthesis